MSLRGRDSIAKARKSENQKPDLTEILRMIRMESCSSSAILSILLILVGVPFRLSIFRAFAISSLPGFRDWKAE